MGGWRRSLGTHGRTGTILKNQADRREDITVDEMQSRQWKRDGLRVAVLIARLFLYSRTKSENCDDVARASRPCRHSPKVL